MFYKNFINFTFLFLFFHNALFSYQEKDPLLNMNYTYFKNKIIVPKNSYLNIQYEFKDPIQGLEKEIIYQLRKIIKFRQSYYKVYYNEDSSIYGYQFFNSSRLKSYAKYFYLKNSVYNKLKLDKIYYYKPNGDLDVIETMIYNKNRLLTKTKRILWTK